MPIDALLTLMARLRDPKTGCPWDVEQNFATIAPHTLEEAYEVADAIAEGDMQGLKEELGDLLLQVVFHAQMAKEAGLFDFNDVVRGIHDKLIRRHPHVFGDAEIRTADEQTAAWEAIKAQEKAAKNAAATSILDDVPRALPALTRALKLQKKAAKVGFDWPDIAPIFAKLTEELGELKDAIAGPDEDAREDELGDVLFVIVNLARHLKLDPEEALRRTNRKFTTRFAYIERALAAQSRTLGDATLEEMDALWDQAKKEEGK